MGGGSFRLSPPTNTLRIAWPQYGYLLIPRSERLLWIGDLAMGAIGGTGLYIFAVLIGVPSRTTMTTFMIVSVALALSGTKVGQSRYTDELERTHFLAKLAGGPPLRMYREASSRRGLTRACVAGFATGCLLLITCFNEDTPIVESLFYVCTISSLVVAGLIGYQVCAQAAVLLNSFRLPQYIYLVFSIAVVTPAAVMSLASLTDHQASPLPSRGVLATCACAAVLACFVLLAVLNAAEMRLVEGRDYGNRLPQFRRTTRNLPLPLKLWTTRGRAYGSVIMGLTAILAIVVLYLPSTVSYAMRGLPGYKQTNVAVAVLYLVVLLTMHVVEAPLELKEIPRRSWLREIASIKPNAEMLGSAALIAVVSAAMGLASVVALMRALPEMAALHIVTLTLVLAAVVLGASGLILPSQAGTTRRLAAPNMLARTFRSAFVALLASCLAVGYESAESPGPVGLSASWFAMLTCVCYLASQTLRQIQGETGD